MIRDFQDILDMAYAMEEPQRLLLLLAKADSQGSLGSDGHTGTLTPIICVDKAPEEIDNFASLVAEADQVTTDWDMMLVASLSGAEGNAPTSEQAEPHLDRMANDVLTGQDLTRYVIFDRQENLVMIEPKDGYLRI